MWKKYLQKIDYAIIIYNLLLPIPAVIFGLKSTLWIIPVYYFFTSLLLESFERINLIFSLPLSMTFSIIPAILSFVIFGDVPLGFLLSAVCFKIGLSNDLIKRPQP